MPLDSPALERQVVDGRDRLFRYMAARDFAGPDPYDALTSPLAALAKRPRLRQALLQVNRRSPIDLRPVLRTRRLRMATTLGLVVSGLVRRSQPDDGPLLETMAAELRRRKVDAAWGYEFDVQTRWGYYPAGSPNIVATAFVLEGLHDAGQVGDTAEGLAAWLSGPMRHPQGFIRYVPGDESLIHNGNLLGARSLDRVAPRHPAVAEAVAVTVAAQQADGTWPYGQAPNLSWVDSFHTAYVLACLADLEWVDGAPAALDRGIEAWASTCFELDGTPRYYAGKAGSADANNVATAVETLARFQDRNERCRALLPGAIRAALAMQRSDGAIVTGRAKVPYMRWNQASMFRALAEVAR